MSEEINFDYLNENFFKKAVEHGLKVDDIQIKSVGLSKATAAGDNYSSYINRAQIQYKLKNGDLHSISLIIKSIPPSELRSIMFEMEMPAKEKDFYQDFIPKMEALFPNMKFAAKLLYAIEEPVYTMVFEDLKAEGFILAKRQEGLNEKECAMVLERLGKYHAASMYLMEKDPLSVQSNRFQHGIFSSKNIDDPLLKVFFIDSLETAISIVESWKDCNKYVHKMKKIHANIKERLLEIVKPVENEVKVIVHGDLWVNNLMFKYKSENSSELEDVRFVDFQNYYVISPGIDLNYFFSTSVTYDVLEKRDALIECYYHSLRTSLESLSYKNVPSLDQIYSEIRRKAFYAFISAVSVLPILCIDENDSKDCSLELLADKNAAEMKRIKACKSKRYERIMKYILQYVYEMGGL